MKPQTLLPVKTGLFFIKIFLLCYYLSGCRDQSATDTDKIAAACIRYTIGTGDSAKMAFRNFDIPDWSTSFMTKEDIIMLKKRRDSTKAILDSKGAYINVRDTLFDLSDQNLSDISNVFKEVARWGIDSGSYVYEKNIPPQKIGLDYLAKTIGISVKDTALKEFNDIRLTDSFAFSTICYSKEKDKAMVYQSMVCGSKCGHGSLVFLKKVNTDWVVEQAAYTWQN